jgi:hypothetical protein
VDTTFPFGRNDALQWNIRSQVAGKIPVEIRYFTSGITCVAELRRHRQRGRDEAERDRLRAGDQIIAPDRDPAAVASQFLLSFLGTPCGWSWPKWPKNDVFIEISAHF